MARQKKIETVQVEEKPEVEMTDTVTEEMTTAEVDNVLEQTLTELDLARIELSKVQIEIQERKKELESAPAREISPDERKIIDKQVAGFTKKAALSDKIEKQKAYDSELVTGKFMNRRAPGQQAKLTYIKYADDPVKWYIFEDGKIYTIPRGFADQINEHYYTPHFNQKQGEMDPNKPASAIHEIDTSNKKYAFVPMNF